MVNCVLYFKNHRVISAGNQESHGPFVDTPIEIGPKVPFLLTTLQRYALNFEKFAESETFFYKCPRFGLCWMLIIKLNFLS